MNRLHAVALGPHVEMPPRKDFTKLPAGISLSEAWKIVGPSVEMNIGRAPLWQVIASAYVEGVMHGAGTVLSEGNAT